MKTNLDKLFKTSEDLEREGVWFDISTTTGFLLRPFKQTNPRVKAAIAAHYKPYARAIEMGQLEQSKQLEINIKCFLDICLADWKGVEIDDKEVVLKDLPKEQQIEFFRGLPDLFDTLWKAANDYNNYREDLGNS